MQITVKTSKIEDAENVKGLAIVSWGDAFKAQSIAIMEGKNGLFVKMPSYKSKQPDEHGNPVYKDVCNPITKEFRDQLYDAIIKSFNEGRDVTIGEEDGKKIPAYGVKVIPVSNAGSTVGLARIYIEDAFVVNNVSVKKSNEGKLFASMPSFMTTKIDENGRAVYKDICFPATKEFRNELNDAIVNAYHEASLGIDQPNHATLPQKNSYEQAKEAGLPFVKGLQDPARSKPEKEAKKATAEKPKSGIRDKIAKGEEKESAQSSSKKNKEKQAKEAVLA